MRGSSGDDPIKIADPLDRQRFPIEEWRLTEARYSTEELGVAETLFAVGNGYLGMRGNVEEGRETHAHGTFVNGFHEVWPIRHAEEAFGFARVGQTIVNVPDNKTMKLYVDDEPMLFAVADLEEYERTLDFRDGVLRRDMIWRTPSGKRVKVSSRRMVSFTQRHLAIMTIEVTMLDEDAPVVVSSQTLNRQDGRDEYHVRAAAMGSGVDPRKAESFESRVLEPQSHWCGDGRIILGYRCYNSKMTLAVGVDHSIDTENSYQELISADEDTGKMVYRVDAKIGQPIKIIKVASYHTSRGVPVRELVDRCRRTLDRTAEQGVEQQFADQRTWLDGYWARSDVEVVGQPAVQQAVRWNLFQLAQATARAEQSGVPAKGVSGSGYGGHYFWDTEIYVLPFLSYTSPKMARSALRFRYNMLDAARRRAQDLAQSGALFPWRTINGEEASAYYAAGTAQYHIDADIAFALCKYVSATGDDGLHAAGGRRDSRGDGPDVGRSRLLAGAEPAGRDGPDLPHPRGHGPRRVHHGGQRQPVHQRDGPLQPRDGGRGRPEPAEGGRRPLRLPGAAPRHRGARGRRLGRGRRVHGDPVRPRHRDQPAGLPLPGPRGLGSEEHPRRQAAAAAALPPAGDLPLPGAQAGRCGAGDLPPG